MSSTESTPSDLDLALARIVDEVGQSQQVDRSAELLIGSLAQQLRDAATAAEDAASDPDAPTDETGSPVLTTLIAKLNELADGLDSSQGTLSAAVTANTPAAPDAQPPAITQDQINAGIESGDIVVPTAPVTQEAVDQALADGTVVVPLEHAVPVVEAAIAGGTLQAAGTQAEAPSNQTTSGDKPAGEWDPSDVEPGDGAVTDTLGLAEPVVSIPDAADDAVTKNDGETQAAATE